MSEKNYYLGLDIGTDSVGYAVSDEAYGLLKFKGEPVWGVTTFEAASLAEERRMMRTARRRLDRRQQRVQLVNEIFAEEIGKIDPNFFVRRMESALFAEDTKAGVKLFDGGMTDREYHAKYPTIHHLILELMNSSEKHDIRLVYLACSWLVANRGHFLFDIAAEQVGDFGSSYHELCSFLKEECGAVLPWPEDTNYSVIQEIMQTRTGVTRKQTLFSQALYGGKKPEKAASEEFPFSRAAMIALLSGGKVSPKELYQNDAYAEVDSVSLSMDEENFARILSELGEDGQLLSKLRAMYDCALLNTTLNGKRCISEAKVAVYDQHKKDLAYLKAFVRKYKKDKYYSIFRAAEAENYTAYSYNVKSCKNGADVKKKANKDVFSDYLLKQLKGIQVSEADSAGYEEMMERLRLRTFLPKQKDTDNRVIPQQLYRVELAAILDKASGYLPMLNARDASGLSNRDKLLSVFDFRIPYFVGPLNRRSDQSWVVRDPGKIYPWNFSQKVDLDASEQAFIKKMTNTCTYLPGEPVLPVNSLLYSRFAVLNELNNLKLNQHEIPVAVKQEIYTELFEKKNRKVTSKAIGEFLRSRGYMQPGDQLSGIDIAVNATLKPWHSFARLMQSGALTQEQVEEIINHAAYSEDKNRMNAWLERTYPHLLPDDRRYILRLNLKEFGRLSRKLLAELVGAEKTTGEAFTMIDALWQTNNNLMQLLSDRFTFREQIDEFAEAYYSEHKKKLSERLDDMYISNAVKRPIFRTLDITSDVVKAMGCPPAKIFVEMARGASADQRGNRTVTRRQRLLDLYKQVRHEDVPRLMAELEAMGETADNRLQSDRLFLYYMQLGRCMYTGQPIELSQLSSTTYDIDHIYPQSKVQDDSILNNKVLVLSSANGAKSDRYPVAAEIRQRMHAFWDLLKNNGLITEEKHRRLTRAHGFSDEELQGFINRQLVETRQSTKAVAQLLKERYPDTEIVYVKAGLVSQFRQEFKLLKCRSVNNLHHAKDAYLNIVAGNVYHERFNRRWFSLRENYSLNTDTLFNHPLNVGGKTVWRGEQDLAKVRKVMGKNAIHLTRYAFCRKGGLFDQMPVKAGEDLIPRKAGLNTEKYGGYNKAAASFYMLASYSIGKKKDVMFVPIELLYGDRVQKDKAFALDYVTDMISRINSNKPVSNVQLLLNGRPIKINTVIEMDGMRVTLNGKTNKGANVLVSPIRPLVIGEQYEVYIKRLERFAEKRRENSSIQLNEIYDCISAEENRELYQLLLTKMETSVFGKCPGNFAATLRDGIGKFEALSVEEQVKCLLTIVSWFGRVPNCDLVCIGGKAKSGTKVPSAKLSAWAKNYSDVRIIDQSASGLYESRSGNLLELL